MVDINMSLDDYAKQTFVAKKRSTTDKPTNKSRAVIIPKAARGGSTAGTRGGRGGGRGGHRSRKMSEEDTRKGRSDLGSWKHDRFEGKASGRGGNSGRFQAASSQRGVLVEMYDVHYDISLDDLKDLFHTYSKDITFLYDENDRPAGLVNIVCKNMSDAQALVNDFGDKILDNHPLKFKVLTQKRPEPETDNRQKNREGPDASRAETRMSQYSEGRGRGRSRRGGRGGNRATAEIRDKRANIKKDRKKFGDQEKPKSASELNAEMEKFAMKNATPESLDAQMEAFSKEREAVAAKSGDGPEEATAV